MSRRAKWGKFFRPKPPSSFEAMTLPKISASRSSFEIIVQVPLRHLHQLLFQRRRVGSSLWAKCVS